MRSVIAANQTLEPEQAELLDDLQRRAFHYFTDHVNPANGLIADSTREGAPSSIAAVGFALAAYPVSVERGFITRRDATDRTLSTLRFLRASPQGPEPDATGYRGFYYHFLDMQSGRRTWQSELSTIDSACLIAGGLLSAQYFDEDEAGEREIRAIAEALYRRTEWCWAQHDGVTVTHGWTPEGGFLPIRWEGYNEALVLYALALGSPEHAVPPQSYAKWTAAFHWQTLYGYEHLYAAPLFIHQFSHTWIDLRGIQDGFMRAKGIDYFENSRRATQIQQRYAIENPKGFKGYHERSWGITAGEGPGEVTQHSDGVERHFYGYQARGVPDPDDGTLSPWVVVASLPFAPDIVLPTIEAYRKTHPELLGKYGLLCSHNPTFVDPATSGAWHSAQYYGLNEGPNILMIENYRTGLIWGLMRQCPYLVRGLRRAGFSGGWLGESSHG